MLNHKLSDHQLNKKGQAREVANLPCVGTTAPRARGGGVDRRCYLSQARTIRTAYS